jgi:hypothetical protein
MADFEGNEGPNDNISSSSSAALGNESEHNAGSRDDVVVKIGLVGDAQVGRMLVSDAFAILLH